MIRAYYHHEKPIPVDLKDAYRLARATTPSQRKAVEIVLKEFFVLEADGWHQKRCDAEISRYQDKQAKAKRSADARWKKDKPQCERMSDGNANACPDAMRTHSEGNAPKHQAPDTSQQPLSVAAASEPEPPPRETPPDAADSPANERAIELAGMLRKRGAALQASDPRVMAWAKRGVTDAQALTALETAQQRRSDQGNHQPINAGYLDAILTDLQSEPIAIGAKKPKAGPPWWSSDDRILAKGREVGLEPRAGEDWPAFRSRIEAKLSQQQGGAAA